MDTLQGRRSAETFSAEHHSGVFAALNDRPVFAWPDEEGLGHLIAPQKGYYPKFGQRRVSWRPLL